MNLESKINMENEIQQLQEHIKGIDLASIHKESVDILMESDLSKEIKPINSTFIYMMFDKALGGDMKDRIKGVLKGATITYDDLEDQFRDIKKFSFPHKEDVLNMVKEGRITLKYEDAMSKKLHNSLSAFIVRVGSKVSCIVNLSNYMTITRDGEYKIDSLILFALLTNGYNFIKCFNNWSAVTSNHILRKNGSEAYAKMMTNVLNRKYSLSTVPDTYDTVIYLTSKFFLLNLMQLEDSESIRNIAIQNCKNMTKVKADIIDVNFNFTDFETIMAFISKLAVYIPQLKGLKTRQLIHEYVQMYGESTLFAIEYLPAFINIITNCNMSVYLNKKPVIDNIIINNSEKFFNKFLSIDL